MERVSKSLEINKTLNEAIPTLVEVFVSFYGEECRAYITDKFNNMIIVGYYDDVTLNTLVSDLQKKISANYIKEVFDKFQIEYNQENIVKYTDNNTFEYFNLFPIIKVYKYISMIKRGEKELLKDEQIRRYNVFKAYIPELELEDFINENVREDQINKLPYYIRSNINYWVHEYDISKRITNERNNVIDNIKALYPEVTTENVTELILNGKFDRILEIGRVFVDVCEKYNTYSEENINKYATLRDKLKDLKLKIEHKYLLEYLLELKEYLNEEDQKILDEISKKGDYYISDLAKINIVLGNSLHIGDSVGLTNSIQYFDSKSEEDLNNPKTKLYRVETIKKNRIKYFKYRGLDLGDNYEDYVNNPKCKELWPSQEMIDRIEDRYKYYCDKANLEYYTSFDIYHETIERMKEANLLDKESFLEPGMFLGHQTCVLTNIREDNEGYKLYPIVCIYAKYDDFDDKALIHELNHLFELTLTKATKSSYEVICGWDFLSGAINQDKEIVADTINIDRERRKYESFNEIINELLARKITKEMHDNGIFILNSSDSYRDRGGTAYDFSSFLVEDFFNQYLDDIIASRRDNNIKIIWNKVGKENFDELNQLLHEFNEDFPEFVYYRLCDDIKNERNTELVSKYNSLIARRDLVLKKMSEHSKSNGINL